MKKILVVEDEESQRILYQQEFTEMGYDVALASDGEEALRMAQQNRPDLVILDIRMPGLSGFDVLRDLLNDEPRIPVIINTAYTHYKEHFMSWAADEYIVKSSDLTELKKAVRKILPQK
ncbi:MAG: response regulator [Calditrichaeota bacterium]|nr:response regulator [Calditrichota bacterium]RQV92564.1 MAG: response regulator [bacterium]RQV99638.1 MAG: response regulator [Calditrichota bacterium]